MKDWIRERYGPPYGWLLGPTSFGFVMCLLVLNSARPIDLSPLVAPSFLAALVIGFALRGLIVKRS